uniref:Uncharacterized protein n=1 Tax=Proboscia inermis TaxID=420281 RepID=A0A7S0CIM6_9STRA|mmetsp:Transcript_50691/g.51074  ORF Transcript_50691/g.51074 Transcript_50691/m.51074 type:complete len:125 (+) Transcript_50691:353-727(+)
MQIFGNGQTRPVAKSAPKARRAPIVLNQRNRRFLKRTSLRTAVVVAIYNFPKGANNICLPRHCCLQYVMPPTANGGCLRGQPQEWIARSTRRRLWLAEGLRVVISVCELFPAAYKHVPNGTATI